MIRALSLSPQAAYRVVGLLDDKGGRVGREIRVAVQLEDGFDGLPGRPCHIREVEAAQAPSEADLAAAGRQKANRRIDEGVGQPLDGDVALLVEGGD